MFVRTGFRHAVLICLLGALSFGFSTISHATPSCESTTVTLSPDYYGTYSKCPNQVEARQTCFDFATSHGYSTDYCGVGSENDVDTYQACLTYAQQHNLAPSTCGYRQREYWGAGGLRDPPTGSPVTFYLTRIDWAKYYVFAEPEPEAECGSSCGNGGPETTKVADPVSVVTGNVFKSEHDFASLPIEFNRYYNSRSADVGDLSAGWTHSYSRRIIVTDHNAAPRFHSQIDPNASSLYNDAQSACVNGFIQIQSRVASWIGAAAVYEENLCKVVKGGQIIGILPLSSSGGVPMPLSNVVGFKLVRDDGQVIRLWKVGATIYAPPSVLIRVAEVSGGYSVTDVNDTIETYDAAGRLLVITTREGRTKTIGYDASGRLTAVTDQFGHALTISYNASNRVSTATTDATTVSYSYDTQNRLSLVTYPDTTTRQYLYENTAFPNALTGAIDEAGLRFSTWVYDTQGRATLTEEAGGAGRTTLAYNADGSVTVNDALGAVRSFTFSRVGDRNLTAGITGSQCPTCLDGKATTYNSFGWLTSRTDYNNNVTQYTYDNARGVELTRTEAFDTPRARTIATTWHATFRLPTSVSIYNGPTATGTPLQTTTFTHDAQGNVLTATLTDTVSTTSRTWTYTYNGVGQVLTVNGPRTDVADITTYTYYSCATGNACGQVATITNALNQTITFNSYNAAGQPLTVTDANGVLTTLAYDTRQRLLSRTVAGEITSIEYWSAGLVRKVTLPDGSFLTYGYDDAHRLIEIQDSEGNRIVYTLDATGNRTKQELFDPSNALTQTQTSVFNQLSQLYQVVGAAGTPNVTTTFGYDANGNSTTINAPLGRNSSSNYDELNRPTRSTDASGTSQLEYNALDQLISVTDPRNLVTTYTYNALGDLKTQISPDTGTTINTFDSAGNLKSSKDARNKTATYTYDADNRVTQVSFGDQTITYGYDSGANGVGRLTIGSDANHSQSWTYDALGRVTSKTQTVGTITKAQGYGYTNGQLTSLKTPYGAVVGYSYTQGKVTGITVNGASLLNNVLYEPFGPTSGWTWGNGTLAVRIFDTDGNLTQIDSAGLKTYAHDDAFRITAQNDTVSPANSWTYVYDTMDRLSSATSAATTQSFTFDADGNRVTQSGTMNTTFAYPATNNKLSSASGSLTKTYSYDAAGNTLSDGTIVYTYNNRGRMKTAKNGAASAVTYTYDGFGQRIKKTGTTRYFVYDEVGHLQGEYNSSGTMVQEFVWLGDIPVGVLTPKTGGVNIFYIHTDHLNSPRKITRPSDNKLRWTYNPDPYGKGAPNENPEALGAFVFNLRFPGQYFDSETGNHYNYYRDYDPNSGRYVQSDPIGLGGGMNTFGYADGNPLHSVDPYGQSARDILGYVPILGSGLDAYDAFKCGNVGMGLLNAGLALMDATGAGALAKGLTVGAFKIGARGALKDAYADGLSSAYKNVRKRMLRRNLVAKGVDVHHWWYKQADAIADDVLNQPWNLIPNISDYEHNLAHHGNALQRFWYGTPRWFKSTLGGIGSWVGGLFSGSGCECNDSKSE
jgi:RHS repeat-associated protein